MRPFVAAVVAPALETSASATTTGVNLAMRRTGTTTPLLATRGIWTHSGALDSPVGGRCAARDRLHQDARRLVFGRPRLARPAQGRIVRRAFGDRGRTARMKTTT